MRGDRVVVEHGLGGIHELLAILDVSGITGHCVHQPEFGERKADARALPLYGHSVRIDFEIAARDAPVVGVRLLQRIQSAEQCGDPRHQVRQADVLCQIVVGAEAQPGHRIELTVAGRQENNRQIGRLCAQLAAQFEAALDVVLEVDIDDDEIR